MQRRVFVAKNRVEAHIPFLWKSSSIPSWASNPLSLDLAATGRLNRMKCFVLHSSLGVSRGEGKSVPLSGRCIVGCLQSLWCAGQERTIGRWDASVFYCYSLRWRFRVLLYRNPDVSGRFFVWTAQLALDAKTDSSEVPSSLISPQWKMNDVKESMKQLRALLTFAGRWWKDNQRGDHAGGLIVDLSLVDATCLDGVKTSWTQLRLVRQKEWDPPDPLELQGFQQKTPDWSFFPQVLRSVDVNKLWTAEVCQEVAEEIFANFDQNGDRSLDFEVGIFCFFSASHGVERGFFSVCVLVVVFFNRFFCIIMWMAYLRLWCHSAASNFAFRFIVFSGNDFSAV